MKPEGLAGALESLLHGRVVLMGVGSEWRGDDQAGSILARGLVRSGRFCPIDCGDVPEAYTGPVKDFQPDTILIADALDLGEEPGAIAILDADGLTEKRFDTHHASLRTVIDYLRAETGAEVVLIGIQPAELGLGAGLSPAVRESVELLRALINELLGMTSDEGATT
ncbi:MAG: hydrogenase 3 maturation endopeptidase HyCI [bacterium]|jgi:hydrogenase 3 maturation protease|nr:hydrogenase 3 maturation endopeptidase HyCI [candidate division KSB1 bacterium]MDH7558725.1 hydrogenase 3 maturation endopeptidase HyCI [bacterium]